MLASTRRVTEKVASGWSALQQPRLSDMIPFDLSGSGVTLHIDRKAEEFWIDVEIEHDPFTLVAFLEIAYGYGDLVLDDAYYDEQQADGRLRSYLLEKEIER